MRKNAYDRLENSLFSRLLDFDFACHTKDQKLQIKKLKYMSLTAGE